VLSFPLYFALVAALGSFAPNAFFFLKHYKERAGPFFVFSSEKTSPNLYHKLFVFDKY